MAAGKHIGKVIVKMRNEKESLGRLTVAIPRHYCFSDHSYIILGGLGGFGLELGKLLVVCFICLKIRYLSMDYNDVLSLILLVDWLILRGAKNLILVSRNGIKTGYQKMRVSLWESYDIKVIVVKGEDVSKVEDCQSIIKAAMKLGPVDAVYNLAAVVKDATWENQTEKLFEESFSSKARAMKHFDALTRQMCPKLRHFVVFSSVACGRGNAGQTNYSMANSVSVFLLITFGIIIILSYATCFLLAFLQF
jgi:fatty acid synthase